MIRLCLTATAILLLLGACGAPEEAVEEPWVEYALRGVVVDLRPGEPPVAVVEHEEIGEWMKAMTMGFPIRDAAQFAQLSEGDHIEATVMAKGYAEYYLDQVKIVEAPESEMESAPAEEQPAQ